MSIFLVITKFLPLLIATIQLLDKLFPAAQIGSFKFAVVSKVLAALKPYLAAGNVPLDELLTMVVPALVNDIVTAMNGTPATWAAPVVLEQQ